MRLILLLAWRHLVHRPGKTLASVLGVAVGIATVISVLVVDHNTLLSQTAGKPTPDPDVDLLIQPELKSVQDFRAVSDDLRGDPYLSGVVAFATGVKSLAVGGRTVAGVELMALEQGAAGHHGAYVVAEGEDLAFDLDVPQLLVGAALAEEVGLSVGDLVELADPVRKRAAIVRCIEGELVTEEAAGGQAAAGPPRRYPFRIVGILAPTRLGYARQRVLTTFRQGQQVLGRTLAVRFWADFDKQRTDLTELTRRLGDRYVVSAPKTSLAGLAPEEKAFRSGVRFCGFLALFLGLYIIFNTMSMSLVERVRSIGLLRALGVGNGRLLAIFLVEGLVLALLGAGAALLLADLIVDLLVDLKITTLGFGRPLQILETPWPAIAAVTAAGVLFCLAGVLYPFLRAARLSVIDALRRGVIELSRDPFTGVRRSVLIGLLAVVPVAWAFGAPAEEYIPQPLYRALLTGFGLVGSAFALLLLLPGLLTTLGRGLTRPFRGPAATLTRATLAAARQRVFGIVSGLMLVFTAIFLIVSVLESLKAETVRFGERALSGRLYLETTPAGAERLPALAAAAPELAGLAPINAETTSTFLVRAVDPALLAHGSLADDERLREAFANERSILLSTRCADDHGKAPGDTVRLATAADGLVDFRILAVTDEYGYVPDDRVFGVVSTDTMVNLWCIDGSELGGWFTAWTPGLGAERAAELRALAVDLLGEEHVLDFARGEDVTAGYVYDLDRDFAIFYAILVLTVLLAAVGILNAMVISVMERRREIGLLRTVGLTGGQVASMLLLESGVLGLLGGLFGLALGIPLAVVTVEALTAVSHLDLLPSLSPRALGFVLGGAVLVAVVAVLLPALRANRMRLSSVVRYE